MSNGAYLFGGPEYVEVNCKVCGKTYRTTLWLAQFGTKKKCDSCEEGIK